MPSNHTVYNILQAAELLGVHERTVRYWLRKGKIKSHKDHRNYPVFTTEDIKKIDKWHKTLTM
jgi:excisionase family DNA binding protein